VSLRCILINIPLRKIVEKCEKKEYLSLKGIYISGLKGKEGGIELRRKR